MSRAARKARLVNRLILAAFLVLAAVFVVALVMLIRTLSRYKQSADLYEQAAAFAVPPSVSAVETPTPSPAPTGEDRVVYAGETASAAPRETPPVAVDFDGLADINSEIEAWLYCADTPINYPVMLGDDNTYYLTHAYNRKKSEGGALFFDMRTDAALTADHLIIYGHHMKDRSMFGSLKRYRDGDYYAAHPVLYLLTRDGNYRIELFSSRTCSSDPDYYPVWFQNGDARSSYIRKAIDDSGLPVAAKTEEYRLVTLVTCSYSGDDDAKYLLHGWLVPLE